MRAALALLFAAVTYNFPLAMLNAHGFVTGRNILIGVETLILGSALAVVAFNWRAAMTRWLLMIAAFLALSLVLTLLRQGFDPKSLRDMLMLATFVMLGMLVSPPELRRFLVGMQALILGVMLIEVYFPAGYAALLDPRSYFINSRGFDPDQLRGELDLFGALRPGERYFLPFLGWNRASSIFLEPLSLGNYAAFATLLGLVFWRDWSPRLQLFMVVSTALILVGSDSRFAAATAVLLLLGAPVMRRLPVPLAALYLPLAVVAARLASRAFGWNPIEDNFPGRIARGMKQLFKLDAYDLAGFSVPTPALADSGIAYLVMSQSLAGVAMLMLFLYLQPELRRGDQKLVVNGTALSFALSILVSISMLSIKTAAFYWMLVGSFVALDPPGLRSTDRHS